MVEVLITGGIGSGKSLVSRIFSILGFKVYNADERAKYLTQNNESIKKRIILLLGKESFNEQGVYNRKYVASKVFENQQLLLSLNQIIHPAVQIDFEEWLVQNKNEAIIFKEAAIVTSETKNKVDFIIFVSTKTATRIKRIKKRDPQRTEAEIQGIIKKQLDENTYKSLADFIIENDNDQLIITQIFACLEKIKKATQGVAS